MDAEATQTDLRGIASIPGWPRRSRWFPNIDAGDALVLSLMSTLVIGAALLIVFSMQARMFGTFDPLIRTAAVRAGDDGYFLAQQQTQVHLSTADTRVGQFVWSEAPDDRGFFGPFTILAQRQPRAWIFLKSGRTVTGEQARQLIAAAPTSLEGYTLPDPTGVLDLSADTIVFRFTHTHVQFHWAGVLFNTGFWLVLVLGLWCFAWLCFAISAFFDPRRRRAIRLGMHLCPRCNYDIRLIDSPRCPECGEALVIDPRAM